MTRPSTPPPVAPRPRAAMPEPASIVQRPDGWYWFTDNGRQQAGPFATAQEAIDDQRITLEGAEPGALLRDAERQIGVADWIDPDTQAPAEDHTPHIEDH
jgi:hypothetical protein